MVWCPSCAWRRFAAGAAAQSVAAAEEVAVAAAAVAAGLGRPMRERHQSSLCVPSLHASSPVCALLPVGFGTRFSPVNNFKRQVGNLIFVSPQHEEKGLENKKNK